ncbi:unnamed protein product [Amoebophrya sp. A120]|nr:unnamed protein product [Amoebophrya sp. A120]|eukprot:GSA120T00020192001.1
MIASRLGSIAPVQSRGDLSLLRTRPCWAGVPQRSNAPRRLHALSHLRGEHSMKALAATERSATILDVADSGAPGLLNQQIKISSSGDTDSDVSLRASERACESIMVAETGLHFLTKAVRNVDPRWTFFPLPHHWPASALVQYVEEGQLRPSAWFPVVVKTTSKVKSGPDTLKAYTSSERKFLYHDIRKRPFPYVLVAPHSNIFFTVPSSAHTQGEERFRLIGESERVTIPEIITALHHERVQMQLRTKSDWFRFFCSGMLASARQAVFCGAIANMQEKVYGPLGISLTFPDDASLRFFNSYVDSARALHRVPSARLPQYGRALRVTTTHPSKSPATRPYSVAEMQTVDFIFALNYFHENDELRGFYMFPTEHLLRILGPRLPDGTQCRRAYWLYFPEDAHAAKMEGVRDRIVHDMEFYVDLQVDGALQKVRKFLDQYSRSGKRVPT